MFIGLIVDIFGTSFWRDEMKYAILITAESSAVWSMQEGEDILVIVADGVEMINSRIFGIVHVVFVFIAGGETPAAVPIDIVRSGLLTVTESYLLSVH